MWFIKIGIHTESMADEGEAGFDIELGSILAMQLAICAMATPVCDL